MIVALLLCLAAVRPSHAFLQQPTQRRRQVLASSLDDSVSYRLVEDTTRDLLNRTLIGSWEEASFQNASRMMEIWSGWQSRRSALNVERILRRVVEEQMSGNPYADNVDMTQLYGTLIRGWGNSGVVGGAERAEEILDYMQLVSEEYDSDDPLLCGPSVENFNDVMIAYANMGRPDGPKQTLRVLRKLYEWRSAGRIDVLPNKASYAAVLRAYAKQGTPNSPEIVFNLLKHMNDMAMDYPSIKPDFNGHNAYIVALLEASSRGHIAGNDAADQAEKHLHEMMNSDDEEVNPDTWSFNMALSIWSRSGSYRMIERAETLVQQLEEYHAASGYSDKTRPNSHTYNVLIACYSRSALQDKADRAHAVLNKMQKLVDSGRNPDARPDTITFNSVMTAYARSKDSNAPLEVEALLEEMHTAFNERRLFVRPNSRSYNICLDAWAKSGLPGSAQRIQKWINYIEENSKNGTSTVAANKWTYTAYIQALSKSGDPNMGEEAEHTLQIMNDLANQGRPDLKPDVLTMTNVIHCIALSGREDALERSVNILNSMEDLHADGYGDVRPNLFTYNCVINAAAKSKLPNKADIALGIFRRMESVALKPHAVSYNNVLNACAFSNLDDNHERVLQIALDMLREAQAGPGANFITYQTALRVVCTFCDHPMERWRLTREVLGQCMEDGQLTRSVMQQARFAVSSSQFEQLKKQVVDSSGKLRKEYTANAHRTKMTPPHRASTKSRLNAVFY